MTSFGKEAPLSLPSPVRSRRTIPKSFNTPNRLSEQEGPLTSTLKPKQAMMKKGSGSEKERPVAPASLWLLRCPLRYPVSGRRRVIRKGAAASRPLVRPPPAMRSARESIGVLVSTIGVCLPFSPQPASLYALRHAAASRQQLKREREKAVGGVS